MFRTADAFNQNIASWNTARVSTMGEMFDQAAAFNQNIASWNTASVSTMYFDTRFSYFRGYRTLFPLLGVRWTDRLRLSRPVRRCVASQFAAAGREAAPGAQIALRSNAFAPHA